MLNSLLCRTLAIAVCFTAVARGEETPATPQGLAAKERPFVELRAVAWRKAVEEVAEVKVAGLFEIARVTGVLEHLRVHAKRRRWRPSNRLAVGNERVIAECELKAMQQAP